MKSEVMTQIWTDQLEHYDLSDMSLVPQMLSSLISLPMVCFRIREPQETAAATAYFAGEEMVPGATLADVLCEEYGIDVTDNTIVYVEPTSMKSEIALSSKSIGQLIGDIIVKLASPGDDVSIAEKLRVAEPIGPHSSGRLKGIKPAELTQ